MLGLWWFGRSASYEAVMAARVTIGGSNPMKSTAACGEVSRNWASVWWHVQCSMETGLLGFSRWRPWGTSVWLVSSGLAWICTDLRLMSRVCLNLLDFDKAQSHGGCEMPWSLDSAEKYVWLQMVICMCESSLLCRDVCLMPRTKFGSDTMLNISIILATWNVIPCCVC